MLLQDNPHYLWLSLGIWEARSPSLLACPPSCISSINKHLFEYPL
jgi:hypothetical protein